jgi:hypothetical protein
VRGAPSLGSTERLYRFAQPSAPFTVPLSTPALPPCGFASANDAAWLVLRTEPDNSLTMRMTNRTYEQRGRRETITAEQILGQVPAIFPPKPRRVSELRQYAEAGNGSANATNLLLGLFAVGLMAAMMPGARGGGGGGGHGGNSGYFDRSEYGNSGGYTPPPPPPSNTGPGGVAWSPSPLGW